MKGVDIMATMMSMGNNVENNGITREDFYNQIINGSIPMDDTGKRFFNKGVSKSMIVFPKWQRVTTSSEKKIRMLAREFDKNLMDPILLIAWPEEHAFHCANGYHRCRATDLIENKITNMPSIILFGPDDPEERKKFEIDIFLRQLIAVEKLTPMQMHEARLEKGDPVAWCIEDVCKANGIKIVHTGGRRKVNVLGSYEHVYDGIEKYGLDSFGWVVDVLVKARYRDKTNGFNSDLVDVLFKAYGEGDFDNDTTVKFLEQYDPGNLKEIAVNTFGMKNGVKKCGTKTSMLLMIQDYITKHCDVPAVFDERGKKVLELKTA